MLNKKRVILIDLDGVLNKYCGNFDRDFIPDVKEGAEEFLSKLSQDFEIKIFTTRNKLLTAKWLIKNSLDKYVNDVTNTKDLAWLYIDDRCLCFEGSYCEMLTQINKFTPYWKNKTN